MQERRTDILNDFIQVTPNIPTVKDNPVKINYKLTKLQQKVLLIVSSNQIFN